jgi:isoquinoline 1-oxidoreductase beta subunit
MSLLGQSLAPESGSAFAIVNVSRRRFLQNAGAGALVLAVGLPSSAFPQQKKYGADAMPHGTVDDPRVFVAIGDDGSVTITCHRAEMGQGVRTGIPMVVADELEADWTRVKVVQAWGDETRFGNQDTDGSRSLRHFFEPMRRCGAAARMMLEMAAAAKWNVSPATVRATNHTVVHTITGRKLGFGELARAAAELPVPERGTLRLKDPKQFRYIGKPLGPVDAFDMTTGRARYGIDATLPGMRFAVIARPPVYGGKVASFDATEAMKIPGVERVLEIPGTPPPSGFDPLGGVAVIARNTWLAIEGRNALKIDWDDGPNASYSSDAYKAQMQASARQPGQVVRSEGDVASALARAAKRIDAEYYVPHVAHATMEPPAALVRVTDGKCEAWACVQGPQAARERLAKHLVIPLDSVTVHQTLLGGGFGRKSKPDFVVEAALLSKALNGTPVKVVWTREDDIQHDYYNTVAVERLEAGLDDHGRTIAWLHRSVSPSIQSTFAPDVKHEAFGEVGQGLTDLPFAIPNLQIENPEAIAHTRIGWFRSVFNIPHAFAIQSFVAELAAAAGRDPKDYLLELIGPPRKIDPRQVKASNYNESPTLYPIDTGRWRRVVDIVAQRSGWGRTLPARHGLGIAAHRSFVTYTAAVIEVAVGDKGDLTVPRVDIAIDCGPQINPDRIRSQIEGAAIMGLSVAMRGGITFKNGRVEQSNFNQYTVLRMNEAPRDIRVYVVPASYDIPLGGVGEPGLPPIAPALCNAIFAATGKRIRSLPITDDAARSSGS